MTVPSGTSDSIAPKSTRSPLAGTGHSDQRQSAASADYGRLLALQNASLHALAATFHDSEEIEAHINYVSSELRELGRNEQALGPSPAVARRNSPK